MHRTGPSRRRTPAFAAALALAIATTSLSNPAAADGYDDAFARAAALERAGDLPGAAAALEAIVPWFPQDYAIVLQLGWIRLREERHARAELHYRDAVRLSHGAAEARLGLGLALAHQGRCVDAKAELDEALRQQPELAGAPQGGERGLALCAPSWTITGSLSAHGSYSLNDPYKQYGVGGSPELRFSHRSGWTFSFAYRFALFIPPAGATNTSWDQHEGYFDLGYGGRMVGGSLQYAVVYDGSGTYGTSHHAGAALRVSPFGDIVLAGVASIYSDEHVFRLAPSWRIPLVGGLSVTAGGAAQLAGSSLYGSGTLTLSLAGKAGALWAGGRYGVEERPADLVGHAIYDIGQHVREGFFAGGSVNVGEASRIYLKYSMDRLEGTTAATPSIGTLHFLSLGTSFDL
jgi:hypothetical protein